MESKIQITPFEDGIIIKISGDLDSLRVMSYRTLILEEMDRYYVISILWDFTNLAFLDSSGIGLILGRYNEIRRLGGVSGITGLTPYTRKIIQMTGLFSILSEFQDIETFKRKVKVRV